MSFDPFKLMARQYDALVVAKGGRSIFGPTPKWRAVGAPVLDGKSAPTHNTKSGMANGPGRPKHAPKPQRIMARTYGLIGAGNLSDFDEMG